MMGLQTHSRYTLYMLPRGLQKIHPKQTPRRYAVAPTIWSKLQWTQGTHLGLPPHGLRQPNNNHMNQEPQPHLSQYLQEGLQRALQWT